MGKRSAFNFSDRHVTKGETEMIKYGLMRVEFPGFERFVAAR